MPDYLSTINNAMKRLTNGSLSREELERKFRLLMGWAGTVTDPKLSFLEGVLETSVNWVNSSGLVILETDQTAGTVKDAGEGRLHIVAIWPKAHIAYFPAWIHNSQTRAGSVLRDAEEQIDNKSFYHEFDAEFEQENGNDVQTEAKPRRSYYRHPVYGEKSDKGVKKNIDDMLFRLFPDGHVYRAIFMPLSIFKDRSSIVCFYASDNKEFDQGFYANFQRARYLIQQTFHFVLPGIAYRLISEVNYVLTKAGQENESGGGLEAALAEIPRMIAEALHCLSVAIVFAANSGKPGPSYYHRPEDRHTLDAMVQAVFHSEQPILVMNPLGEEWPVPWRFEEFQNEATGKSNAEAMSFSRLAVPILQGQNTIAVIACEGRWGVPHVLTEWEQTLFSIIGAHVIKSWAEARTKERLQAENRLWKSAVALIAAANARAYAVLNKGSSDLTGVLTQMLDLVGRVVGGAPNRCWLDIRLLSEDRRALHYCAFVGDYWKQNPRQRDLIFSTGPDSEGKLVLGAWVVKNHKPWHCPDITSATLLPEGTTARDSRAPQFLVIPILEGQREKEEKPNCLGVVDIHMTMEHSVPEHFLEMAEMLGHQIGLFIFLTRHLQGIIDDREIVRKRYQEADTYRRLNLEVMQNVHHQIDLPMVTAIDQLDNLLELFRTRAEEVRKLRAIRAFIKRSWQASSSTNIIRSLTSGKPFSDQYQLTPMSAPLIEHILLEIADDFRYIVDRDKKITIDVKTDGLRGKDLSRFYYHDKLLNQVLGNLFDNACKYSFEGMPISIVGDVSAAGQLLIMVRNYGIPIPIGDESRIKDRGFRSEIAKHFAEGTGIGLWLVDQIMIQLGGALEVKAARDINHAHEFRLIFRPREKRMGRGGMG